MAIFSQLITENTDSWNITLNRLEIGQVVANENEPALEPSDFSFIDNPSLKVIAVEISSLDANQVGLLLSIKVPASERSNLIINQERHPSLTVTGFRGDAPTDATNNWAVTLNRKIGEEITESDNIETLLSTGDITITGENTVMAVSGGDLTRTITLEEATSILSPTSISIANHTGMKVVSTSPRIIVDRTLSKVLDAIRKFVNVDITEEELPDSVIINGYLQEAEDDIIDRLLPEMYDNLSTEKKEHAKLAVQLMAAALLVPALPDIMTGEVYEEIVRYETLDAEKKVENLRNRVKGIIDIIDNGGSTGDYPAIRGSYRSRPICF